MWTKLCREIDDCHKHPPLIQLNPQQRHSLIQQINNNIHKTFHVLNQNHKIVTSPAVIPMPAAVICLFDIHHKLEVIRCLLRDMNPGLQPMYL